MNRNRCVVIAGGEIHNYPYLSSLLKDDDYFVYADCGLRHQEGLGRKPDLIVGDFDSFQNPLSSVETLVLPKEKDDTDSRYAVKEGLARGFKEFLLLGFLGGRFDHSLGNLYILQFLYEEGCKALLVDDYSEMEIVGKDPVYIDSSFPFFSLLNIAGKAEGISIKGAKYPLENGVINASFQYGISNEVIPLTNAEVRVAKGTLLLIKDR